MSGIAEVLANLGFRVTGSDQSKSEVTARLEQLKVEVTEGHDAENVGDAHEALHGRLCRLARKDDHHFDGGDGAGHGGT